MAIRLGLDGIIVSNHGGRQIDAGQSTIRSLTPIVKNYKDKIKIMMDSGIRSGPDVARSFGIWCRVCISRKNIYVWSAQH